MEKDYCMLEAGPGFTLPADIGDLGPDITELFFTLQLDRSAKNYKMRPCALSDVASILLLCHLLSLLVPRGDPRESRTADSTHLSQTR